MVRFGSLSQLEQDWILRRSLIWIHFIHELEPVNYKSLEQNTDQGHDMDPEILSIKAMCRIRISTKAVSRIRISIKALSRIRISIKTMRRIRKSFKAMSWIRCFTKAPAGSASLSGVTKDLVPN